MLSLMNITSKVKLHMHIFFTSADPEAFLATAHFLEQTERKNTMGKSSYYYFFL